MASSGYHVDMNRQSITLYLSLALLCACDAPTRVPPVNGAASQTPVSIATNPSASQVVATGGLGLLRADPATLPDCDPAVVKVRWDVAKRHPEVTTVEIYVIAPGEGVGKLFAAGGAKDTAPTGPWAKSGVMFQARDTAGNELDRITLGGPDCR